MNLILGSKQSSIELNLDCNVGDEENVYIYRQCFEKKQTLKFRIIKENEVYKLQEMSALNIFSFSPQNNAPATSCSGFDTGIFKY